MELLIERCAGLDVHKASVTATVRVPDPSGGRLQQTRSFRATTAGLVLLGDWLASFGVTVVGMESTGVYWRPVYYLLEDDFQCWLLNAAPCAPCPGPSPMWPTRCGSASWSSTAWSDPRSCRPSRSGSCAI